MSVFLDKGERLLDENGRWTCTNGHDKDEVGVYAKHMCRRCFIEHNTRYRHQKGYEKPGYRGDAKPIPNLRQIREDLGLSLSELARMSRVAKSTLSRVERGLTGGGYTTRKRLLQTLGPILATKRRYGY